jgi:hypothetical protein
VTTVTLTAHAESQLPYRGATRDEVDEAINSSSWVAVGRGRLDCRKDFDVSGEWNGQPYDYKQVRPVFIEDFDGVVVVTVYAYFLLDQDPGQPR